MDFDADSMCGKQQMIYTSCIYIFTYIYIYIYTSLHIYISTYIHIYISTYLHIYISTYTYTYAYAYAYTHTHTHTCLYIYPDQPICRSRWDCDALEATLVVGASLDAVCSTGKQNQGHVIVLLCKKSQQISMYKNLNTYHISIYIQTCSNMFK